MKTGHCWSISMALLACLAMTPASPVHAESTPTKVVYHIDDARNGRFALHLAADHLAIDPGIRIAVVTYAAGVDFLLKGELDRERRPYGPDVKTLMDNGVVFKVCSATLGFRNISPERVLDGVGFVPSGTFEIIRLQSQENYVYLKP